MSSPFSKVLFHPRTLPIPNKLKRVRQLSLNDTKLWSSHTKKPLTASYLQSCAKPDKWQVRHHNNKSTEDEAAQSVEDWAAAPLHLLQWVYTNSRLLLQLYFYFASDYEEYGSAWPVNVTNGKQTVLTAVNNYKHRVECFSTADLRNVHHCPLSSGQIGGKVSLSRCNSYIRGVWKWWILLT